MKIFFLGGTFDPPHLGHLGILKECLKYCDKFIFIPSKQNPHKKSSFFSSLHRVEMLKIMTSKTKKTEIDLFEVNSKSKISYSLDTIKYLKNKYPKDCIYMVLGQDILSSLHNWKEWNEIKNMVNIVCLSRPGKYYDNPNIEKEKILFIDSLDLDISSSMIRKNFLSNGLKDFSNMQNMLDIDVFNYIVDNKICQF